MSRSFLIWANNKLKSGEIFVLFLALLLISFHGIPQKSKHILIGFSLEGSPLFFRSLVENKDFNKREQFPFPFWSVETERNPHLNYSQRSAPTATLQRHRFLFLHCNCFSRVFQIKGEIITSIQHSQTGFFQGFSLYGMHSVVARWCVV